MMVQFLIDYGLLLAYKQWGIITETNVYHYSVVYNIAFSNFNIPLAFPELIWSHKEQDLDEAFGIEKNTLSLNGCKILFSQENNQKCFWISLGF